MPDLCSDSAAIDEVKSSVTFSLCLRWKTPTLDILLPFYKCDIVFYLFLIYWKLIVAFLYLPLMHFSLSRLLLKLSGSVFFIRLSLF